MIGDDPEGEDHNAANADQLLRLRGLIDDGRIVIFSEREAKTLLKIAIFFDVEHDDSNLKTLKRVVNSCQSLSMLGVSARFMVVATAALIGLFAALAQLAEKVPLIDRFMHWQSPD